jgi:hypothetical protein
MDSKLISRRTFLLQTSLTPLLLVLSGPPSNFEVVNSQGLADTEKEPIESPRTLNFAIGGWHEKDLDLTKTRLINLSASWKSGWL